MVNVKWALPVHHVLERTDYPARAFRFGHQQFQKYTDISLDSVGPDWRKEVASWPEDVRADLIGDCCTTADLASLASADASPKVKVAAASGLSWRSAEEGLTRVLASMDSQTFDEFVRQGAVARFRRGLRQRAIDTLRCRPKRGATLRSIRACPGRLRNFRGDSTPTLISPSGFIRLPRRRLQERVIGCRENCSRFARLAALAWVLRPFTGSPEQAS